MTPIADAPPTYKRLAQNAKLQEVIDAVNALTDAGSTASLKFSPIEGGAEDAELDVTGIAVADELVSVIQIKLDGEGKVEGLNDITDECEVKAGKVKVGVATEGDQLLVVWNDVSGN